MSILGLGEAIFLSNKLFILYLTKYLFKSSILEIFFIILFLLHTYTQIGIIENYIRLVSGNMLTYTIGNIISTLIIVGAIVLFVKQSKFNKEHMNRAHSHAAYKIIEAYNSLEKEIQNKFLSSLTEKEKGLFSQLIDGKLKSNHNNLMEIAFITEKLSPYISEWNTPKSKKQREQQHAQQMADEQFQQFMNDIQRQQHDEFVRQQDDFVREQMDNLNNQNNNFF